MLAEIPVDPGHPVEVAGDSRTGYVYITNEYGDYIYVLRGVEQVVTLRTGGEKADALAVDEERGWVYVVNKGSDSVTAIRGTEVITTLEVAGDEPRDIAVEPASGWAYIVTGYRKDSPEGEKREVEGNVTVISGTEIVGTISLGRVLANRVVVDPINGYVYVGNVGGEVIVIQGMEEIARLKAGSSINAMDVNAKTGNVYIIDDKKLYQFNEGEFIATAQIVKGNDSISNMQIHPITGDVYIVNMGREVIVVRDMKIIKYIEDIGRSVRKMTIDPLTGNVYVADFRTNVVTVIHNTEVITTFDVGWYPYGIGVNPANGWVYVSNTNDDTVTILGYRE
jgi:DNA-binding beta-propeller fold protein YncE